MFDNISTFENLFEEQFRDLARAEKPLIKALPQVAAKTPGLRLKKHLRKTATHYLGGSK